MGKTVGDKTKCLTGKKNDFGFTLLELCLVITIIGLLAAYGIPKYYSVIEDYRLEYAAQTVSSQLQYGKQMAMDKRETVYVVFTPDRVGLYRLNGSSLEPVGQPRFYEGGVFFDSNDNSWLPEIYGNLTSGQFLGWGLKYNFRGFVEESGSIVLKVSSGKTISVVVAEKTGRITVN